MQNKKYISFLVIVGVMLGLIGASPALAKSNSNGNNGIGEIERQIKKPLVVGTVATINGTTLTVTEKAKSNGVTAVTYTVDASNATVTKNGKVSTVSNIAVGDMVMIQGTLTGTNIKATIIRDGITKKEKTTPTPIVQGNGQPIVAGVIASINGNTISITNKSNITYTIDASIAKIVVGNKISTISNIAVGDTVVVQGAINGTSVTAYSVIDQRLSANNGSDNSDKLYKGFMGGMINLFRQLFGF